MNYFFRVTKDIVAFSKKRKAIEAPPRDEVEDDQDVDDDSVTVAA